MFAVAWVLLSGTVSALWEGAVLPFIPAGLRCSGLVVALVISLIFFRQRSRVVWLGVIQGLLLQAIFFVGISSVIPLIMTGLAFLLHRFWISARTLPAVFVFTVFLESIRLFLEGCIAALQFGAWRWQFESLPWESVFWSAGFAALVYSLGLWVRRVSFLYRPRRSDEDG